MHCGNQSSCCPQYHCTVQIWSEPTRLMVSYFSVTFPNHCVEKYSLKFGQRVFKLYFKLGDVKDSVTFCCVCVCVFLRIKYNWFEFIGRYYIVQSTTKKSSSYSYLSCHVLIILLKWKRLSGLLSYHPHGFVLGFCFVMHDICFFCFLFSSQPCNG